MLYSGRLLTYMPYPYFPLSVGVREEGCGSSGGRTLPSELAGLYTIHWKDSGRSQVIFCFVSTGISRFQPTVIERRRNPSFETAAPHTRFTRTQLLGGLAVSVVILLRKSGLRLELPPHGHQDWQFTPLFFCFFLFSISSPFLSLLPHAWSRPAPRALFCSTGISPRPPGGTEKPSRKRGKR